jgi:hypothetical protein
MHYFSTREAARKLGIPNSTLAKYVTAGKVPGPTAEVAGITTTRLWTEAEIEHARKLLPKIVNGRKTRYQKSREKQKAQAGVPVPHKKKRISKKK